jgi:hypothetical protein
VGVPTDALRSIDVGDWLLLGKANGIIAGGVYATSELTYNISKDIKTEGSSLSHFGDFANLSLVIIGLVFFGCLGFDIQTDFHGGYLKVLFLPFLGLVSGLTVINLLRNKVAKKRILKKYKLAHTACLKNRSEFLIAAQ